MNKNNNDQGFTLVELLIVIVILGILATVTVFAVRGITDKGQENACAVEKRSVETAIESFYAQTGSDPADVAALTGTYLKTDASGNWTMNGSGAAITVTATAGGDCV